jgi:hypothetical protein
MLQKYIPKTDLEDRSLVPLGLTDCSMVIPEFQKVAHYGERARDFGDAYSEWGIGGGGYLISNSVVHPTPTFQSGLLPPTTALPMRSMSQPGTRLDVGQLLISYLRRRPILFKGAKCDQSQSLFRRKTGATVLCFVASRMGMCASAGFSVTNDGQYIS